MIKKMFRKFFILFLLVSLLFASFVGKSFAIVDRALEADYKVIGIDGDQTFSASMPALTPWPDFSEESGLGGDLSIELGNPFCFAYTAAYFTAMYAGNAEVRAAATTSLIVAASTIYSISMLKYRDIEICGANWWVWGSNDVNATSDIIHYYPELGAFKGSRKWEVLNCLKEQTKKACKGVSKDKYKNFSMNDRIFRERYYDGEEVVNNNCIDPRSERHDYDIGGNGQTYYMRGYAQGNYACERFLNFKDAYDCCVKASQSVCLSSGILANRAADQTVNQVIDDVNEVLDDIDETFTIDYKLYSDKSNFFCDKNEQFCTYDGFIYEIFPSETGEKGIYCARTWSLCPYNFNIEKGSEKKLLFEKSKSQNENLETTVNDPCFNSSQNKTLSCAGKIKNFYQYRRHCTIIEPWYSIKDDENNSYAPFIDKSCINFVGSSHNTYNYESYSGYDKIFKEYRSFTAPVVECFTETLKNFLFNRAGHTKCANTGSFPDSSDKCLGDNYEYQKGNDLNTLDPVGRLLKYTDTLLKLVLTIMIVLYGHGILTQSIKLERQDLVKRLIAITLVLTFASSKWWRDQLFTFVYGLSSNLSELTGRMVIDDTKGHKNGQGDNSIKYDGCYFGNINKLFNKEHEQIDIVIDGKNDYNNNYYNYPSSRTYISTFDALDCKLYKYLGISAGKDLPNALKIVALSTIFPFNLGIFLAVASLMLFFFAISFAMKAVYIFVASSIGIAMLLYVSPIIIPCVLFKSQKKIFDTWLKNLIGYALQPMFLLAFISLSLSIMDKYTLGEGIFTGDGPHRELICGYACKNQETGAITNYGNNYSDLKCHEDTDEIINLKAKSTLCFMERAISKPYTALHSIGIFLSILDDIDTSDLIMFLRIAFLFFILNNILGTIPTMAKELSGSHAELPSTKSKDGKTDNIDPFALAKKAKDISSTGARIAKYGVVAGFNLGKKIGKGADNKVFGGKFSDMLNGVKRDTEQQGRDNNDQGDEKPLVSGTIGINEKQQEKE